MHFCGKLANVVKYTFFDVFFWLKNCNRGIFFTNSMSVTVNQCAGKANNQVLMKCNFHWKSEHRYNRGHLVHCIACADIRCLGSEAVQTVRRSAF